METPAGRYYVAGQKEGLEHIRQTAPPPTYTRRHNNGICPHCGPEVPVANLRRYPVDTPGQKTRNYCYLME